MRMALVTILAGLSLSAPGARATTLPPVLSLGTGAAQVWILQPHTPARSIVVFGHGWSTPVPAGFRAWIEHLRSLGNIVIYPRYRSDSGTSSAAALSAFHAGLAHAFGRLAPTQLPVVAVGKSFGASAVFYYGAQAQAWHIPPPAAILSIFPALPIGSTPSTRLPARTLVELLVGDRDVTAGRAGADAFWKWLDTHPRTHKRYVLIRSRPGFVADHDSPQRTDAIAQAVFWRRLDRIVDRIRACGGPCL